MRFQKATDAKVYTIEQLFSFVLNVTLKRSISTGVSEKYEPHLNGRGTDVFERDEKRVGFNLFT